MEYAKYQFTPGFTHLPEQLWHPTCDWGGKSLMMAVLTRHDGPSGLQQSDYES